VLKIYEPAIKKKGIDLVLDVMDFKLYTNKTAFEIILSNLLKNAIEAVDEKGRIEISLRKEGEKTVLTSSKPTFWLLWKERAFSPWVAQGRKRQM